MYQHFSLLPTSTLSNLISYHHQIFWKRGTSSHLVWSFFRQLSGSIKISFVPILHPSNDSIDSVVEEVVFALPEVAAGIERGSAAPDAGALVVELEDDSIDNLLSKFWLCPVCHHLDKVANPSHWSDRHYTLWTIFMYKHWTNVRHEQILDKPLTYLGQTLDKAWTRRPEFV